MMKTLIFCVLLGIVVQLNGTNGSYGNCNSYRGALCQTVGGKTCGYKWGGNYWYYGRKTYQRSQCVSTSYAKGRGWCYTYGGGWDFCQKESTRIGYKRYKMGKVGKNCCIQCLRDGCM